MPNNALLSKLDDVMDRNTPTTGGSMVKDVSSQICTLASANALDELMVLKAADHHIESGVAYGMEGIADGSRTWLITRSKPLKWSQSVFIIVEPSGKCNATVRFEPFGA